MKPLFSNPWKIITTLSPRREWGDLNSDYKSQINWSLLILTSHWNGKRSWRPSLPPGKSVGRGCKKGRPGSHVLFLVPFYVSWSPGDFIFCSSIHKKNVSSPANPIWLRLMTMFAGLLGGRARFTWGHSWRIKLGFKSPWINLKLSDLGGANR